MNAFRLNCTLALMAFVSKARHSQTITLVLSIYCHDFRLSSFLRSLFVIRPSRRITKVYSVKVKIVLQAMSYKQLSSQMIQLKIFGKGDNNYRSGVGRILCPLFAGNKRNAAPLNPKNAEGPLFKTTYMTYPYIFQISAHNLNVCLRFLSGMCEFNWITLSSKRYGVLLEPTIWLGLA